MQVGKLDAATNVDPSQLLDLHNEMVYNPRPANKVFLICLKPAEQVGHFLLARQGTALYGELWRRQNEMA